MNMLNALVAAAALVLPVAAFAGSGTPHPQADHKLVAALHLGNQQEIKVNQLAAEKSATDAVKDYAAMLIKDHSAADEKTLALAQKHGFEPDSLIAGDPEAQASIKAHDELLEKLSALDGAAFDEAFLEAMVSDHEKTIAKIEEALPGLRELDVQQFFSSLLPTLKHHLEEAQRLLAASRG